MKLGHSRLTLSWLYSLRCRQLCINNDKVSVFTINYEMKWFCKWHFKVSHKTFSSLINFTKEFLTLWHFLSCSRKVHTQKFFIWTMFSPSRETCSRLLSKAKPQFTHKWLYRKNFPFKLLCTFSKRERELSKDISMNWQIKSVRRISHKEEKRSQNRFAWC